MARIELDLDRGDVSTVQFAELLTAQIDLVREVMVAMGIPATEVRWVLSDLHFGSARAVSAPQVVGTNVFMADVDRAINQTGVGLESLRNSAERPRYFTDAALKVSRRIVALAAQSDAGRARLVFGATAVPPSERIAANVDAIIKGDLQSIGSIEGRLVGVQGTDGHYKIYVLDRLRGRKIPCHIPPEILTQALSAFERRVIVRGRIISRPDGWPQQIAVRHFEVLPSEFPSWQEMRGILKDYRLADGDQG